MGGTGISLLGGLYGIVPPMRWRWCVLGGAGLLYIAVINATNDPPVRAYLAWENRFWVALGFQYLSHPCLQTVQTEHGTFESTLPTDRCFRMSPPHRMKGVWIDEPEGSQFLLGASDATQAQVGLGGTWLDLGKNRISGIFQKATVADLRAFEIEFVGRQTLVAGRYGHMGTFDHEVVVDRLITARPIDPIPYAKKLAASWERQERR